VAVAVLGIAAATLASGSGPGLLSSSSRHRASSPVAGPSPSAPPGVDRSLGRADGETALDPLDPRGWPVRGDLAADVGFRNAVLAKARSADLPLVRLLYAGTLPDGSRLALLGVGRDVLVGSVHFPRGAPPERIRFSDAADLFAASGLTGWAGHLEDHHVHAVVLAAPGPMRAEVSPEVRYTSDGAAHRQWRRVTSRTGVAVIDLGRPLDPVVGVRLPGDSSSRSVFLTVDPDRASARRDPGRNISIRGLHSRSYAGPDPADVSNKAVDVVDGVLGPRPVEASVLWSGSITITRRAVLLLVRRADGPIFQVLVSHEGDTDTTDIRSVPWANAARMPWLFVPGYSQGHVKLINPAIAARGGTAVIGRAGAAVRRVHIGRDGTIDLARDQSLAYDLYGAPVTVLSASGRLVVRSVLANPDTADLFAVAQT